MNKLTKLGLGPKERPWEAGWYFTAVRSMEIFKIWEEVFGGHERFVRVLPSQSGVTSVSGGVLGFRDAAKHADALATAPYMGYSIGAYSNHGAWGLAEYSDSKPADYSKLAGTLEWAKKHGQPVDFEIGK
jgi:hypothetical protein